jgi:quaternary ammonium compound-resistance protein SugE
MGRTDGRYGSREGLNRHELTAKRIEGDIIATTGVVSMNPWLLLVVAGVFEIGWAIGLEYSEGFTELFPSVITVISLVISMFLLARAVQSLPIGTAYAVWTGIGAVGAATLGIVLFDEPVSIARVGFISLIVVGVVGLNFTAH